MKEQADSIWERLTLNNVMPASNFLDELNELSNNIEHLDCEDCHLENLIPLMKFSKLRVLNISSTLVNDLSGIEQLQELEILYADFGHFKNLYPVSMLKKLRSLDITCSLAGIDDISPLSNLHLLERLYVANNPIKSISPLFFHSNLRLISVSNTEIDPREIEQFRTTNPYCEIWL